MTFEKKPPEGGPSLPDVMKNVQVQILTKFEVNGKRYSSPEEMPPDVRKQYEALMDRIDKDRNGIPDILESGPLAYLFKLLAPNALPPPASRTGEALSQRIPRSRHAVPETSNKLFIVAVIALGAVVYFFWGK